MFMRVSSSTSSSYGSARIVSSSSITGTARWTATPVAAAVARSMFPSRPVASSPSPSPRSAAAAADDDDSDDHAAPIANAGLD